MDRADSGAPSGPPLARVTLDSDEPVVLAVVRAIAAVENVSVIDLPPLAECVDPEALETLVAPPGFTGIVRFEYGGYTVRVEGGETVAIYGEVPEE